MNEALSQKWLETRGLSIMSVGINSVTLPEEDAQIIRTAQKNAIMRDPSMAAATLAGAQADAMKTAAANSAGAITGFMGMGMAAQAGGVDTQALYQMGAAQRAAETAQTAQSQKAAGSWTCSCGSVNQGKFCPECGKPRPAQHMAKFCSECGWPVPDPQNPPKFCPECGKPFPGAAN